MIRVLQAEDDSDIRLLTRLALEIDGGISLSQVSNGTDFFLHLEENQVDAILLDYMMPDCTGEDLLDKLGGRPSWSTIPVVFMTARASEADVARMIDLGASGVITKPFDPLQLASNFRTALRNECCSWSEKHRPNVGSFQMRVSSTDMSQAKVVSGT